MAENWIGKAISIKTVTPGNNAEKTHTYQGIIKVVTPDVITIVRAFKNGVPVRKQDTEVLIASNLITELQLIPDTLHPPSSLLTTTSGAGGSGVTKPTPAKNASHMAVATASGTANTQEAYFQNNQKVASSPAHINDNGGRRNNSNRSPYQSASTSNSNLNNSSKKFFSSSQQDYNFKQPATQQQQKTKPIDMPHNPNNYRQASVSNVGANNNGHNRSNNQQMNNSSSSSNVNMTNTSSNNGNHKNYRRYQHNETFGTPVNDPTMDEDFDFEKNLALFDKAAIWTKIDQDAGGGKPDILRHNKYRHDENVLSSAPAQYRPIEVDYNSSRDYVTDDGLIIPSIPLIVRNRVQTAAEAYGLTWERQIDVLSRGSADIALQLLGGARRFKPTNQHQWPKIVVLCEEPYNERKSEIGICTGRILATHGLQVTIYVKEITFLSRMSRELDLFNATGNEFTCDISQLPPTDLILLSARTSILSPEIVKWISECRAPVLAIDPPANGFVNVQAKCSILPILPLDDINVNACGKLYLCNLGIPSRFFTDAGIKYKSPFGHKCVIPIHMMN